MLLMCRLPGPWFLLDCALQERSRGGCCHQEHVSAQGREVPQRRDCPQAGCCVHPLQWRCWPSRSGCGVGRHAQAHSIKAPGDQCRWPKAACKFFLVLLNNLKANGEAKGLNVENLRISHVQVNQAPVMRRRTYRAHGRVCRRP